MTLLPVLLKMTLNPCVTRAAWIQSTIATILVGMICTVFAALDMAARNEQVIERLERSREERCRTRRWYYGKDLFFTDRGDRLLLEELPSADYSRGGFYLLGNSTVGLATRFWLLPPDQRAVIHNYAVDASNHTMQLQLIRFLVEDQQLFRAGAGKSMLAIGASYHCTKEVYQPDSYFARLWSRHGLYTYSHDSGIHSVQASLLTRVARTERTRVAGFLKCSIDPRNWDRRNGTPLTVRPIDYAGFRQSTLDWMGAQWRQRIVAQVSEFGRLLDYVVAARAQVVVILWPLGTWDNDLPFKRYYIDEMKALCSSKDVKLLDWSGMLEDEDFADYFCHPNVQGSEKINCAVLDLALPHLRNCGALVEEGDKEFRRTSPND